MRITDHDLAIVAAQAGAALVRSYFGTSLTRFQKSADDFATNADLESERAILSVLYAARPDDTVEGEESGRAGTGSSDRMWLVDPLCGTLNFAAGTMLASVNVALRTGDRIAVAACADPFTGEVFWTDGATAHVRHNGADHRLAPSAEPRIVDVNLDPPFPNSDKYSAVRRLADDRFAERFRPRVVSTTLAVTWVAAGRRAAYATDGGDLRDSVHFAAGIAICEAAGCVVTGIDGRPIGSGAGGLVVSADEQTHDALLRLVAAPHT
jgi:myo-inositol-1(or 4)-monophosphatase